MMRTQKEIITNSEANGYVPLDCLASTVGLPKSYLKGLANEGLIPFLEVGGRKRFRVSAVYKALDALASKVNDPHDQYHQAAFGGSDDD